MVISFCLTPGSNCSLSNCEPSTLPLDQSGNSYVMINVYITWLQSHTVDCYFYFLIIFLRFNTSHSKLFWSVQCSQQGWVARIKAESQSCKNKVITSWTKLRLYLFSLWFFVKNTSVHTKHETFISYFNTKWNKTKWKNYF